MLKQSGNPISAKKVTHTRISYASFGWYLYTTEGNTEPGQCWWVEREAWESVLPAAEKGNEMRGWDSGFQGEGGVLLRGQVGQS